MNAFRFLSSTTTRPVNTLHFSKHPLHERKALSG
jgi:hypothetical protein